MTETDRQQAEDALWESAWEESAHGTRSIEEIADDLRAGLAELEST